MASVPDHRRLGARAAFPRARTSARTVEPGESLLLDFGAQVDGYCADLTRTVIVGGRADGRQRMVYDLVRTAQRRALDHHRAGMSGRDADALARDPIAARGFGDAFGHSLGHGLGLEVHEAPRLSATAPDPLPLHAVVTIEPGIYLPGWGGVRLEDDVYLGPGGPVCLSDNRTDLGRRQRSNSCGSDCGVYGGFPGTAWWWRSTERSTRWCTSST